MCVANSCATQCGSSISGGGLSTSVSTCAFSTVQCPNQNQPGQETTCENLVHGLCTSASVQVGSHNFPCTSCADQSSCQQQAAMAACQ